MHGRDPANTEWENRPPSTPSSSSASGQSDTKSDEKKSDEKKSDEKKDTVVAKDSGAKKDEPVRKMYCN